MADATVTDFPGVHRLIAKGVLVSTYTAVAGVTTCLPLTAPNYPDKTVSATGTWGSATLTIEGSNDGTTYETLNDSRGEGNPLTLTANNLVVIGENPRFIRPRTSGGTSTSLTIIFSSQSTRR